MNVDECATKIITDKLFFIFASINCKINFKIL